MWSYSSADYNHKLVLWKTGGVMSFKCVAMLDVFPLSYGFLVWQCLHTVTVLSTNFFPSSLYLTRKPKCSHKGEFNDAWRSSSSVPRYDHAALNKCVDWTWTQLFFFIINQSADHVCAKPKILIWTDHGSMMIRCTTSISVCVHMLIWKVLLRSTTIWLWGPSSSWPVY